MSNESTPTSEQSVTTTAAILQTFDAGFKRLPRMFEGLHKTFDGEFPISMPLFKTGIGRRFLQTLSRDTALKNPHSVTLDPLIGIKQQSKSDCVGAGFMSAFSQITGVNITPELYTGFLQTALKHKLAEQESEGIRVSAFALNVFSTPEFKHQFSNSDVAVAFRRGLSLDELSEIATATKNKKSPTYKLFVLLPFQSWANELGGHLVSLQEISPTKATVYDPNLGEKRIIPNTEFNQRWQYDNKSAIFIFDKVA